MSIDFTTYLKYDEIRESSWELKKWIYLMN